MIRAIIIEDEINNRELLHHMITEYVADVDIIDFAVNVNEGILSIEKHNPDLIFLDIEMPGGNGFDVLKHFTNPNFKVIFVTGYDHYAIKAIKHAAIDYLLKPINLAELKEAITKIKLIEISHTANIEFIKKHITSGNEELTHLLISNYNTNDIVIIKEIIYIETQDRYTIFHLTENRKKVSSLGINFFETLLNPSTFFRIHRSVVVNCDMVQSLSKGRSPEITMAGGEMLQVAYRRKSEFIARLDKST